jgi:hypothetical protein
VKIIPHHPGMISEVYLEKISALAVVNKIEIMEIPLKRKFCGHSKTLAESYFIKN